MYALVVKCRRDGEKRITGRMDKARVVVTNFMCPRPAGFVAGVYARHAPRKNSYGNHAVWLAEHATTLKPRARILEYAPSAKWMLNNKHGAMNAPLEPITT